jgi:hypothetical protein
MKSVRWPIIVAALLFASCGPIGDPPVKDQAKAGDKTKARASDPQELDRLKGAWQVVAIQTSGNNVPDDRVQEINLQYVFQGERVTIWHPTGSSFLTTFSVDATANPKRIR